MWTLAFWQNVVERAVKTAAQFAAGTLVGDAANVLTLDWMVLFGAMGSGALLSILTSLGTEVLPIGNKGTASAVKTVEVTPTAEEHTNSAGAEAPPTT